MKMAGIEELMSKRQKLTDRRLLVDIPEIDTHILPAFTLGTDIQPRLAYMYAYNPTEKRFVALRVTGAGQLLVYGISPATEWKFNNPTVDDSGTLLDLTEEYSTHMIINDGPYDVYVAFGRAATTSDILLRAGEWMEIKILTRYIGLITNTGESTSVRVISTA